MPGQHMDQTMRPTKKRGSLQKRSMKIAGHRTSIALEKEFWERLEKLARAAAVTLPSLIAPIDARRKKDFGDNRSLASAIRVYVLEHKTN